MIEIYLKDKFAQSAADSVATPEETGERQWATLTQSVYAQLRADILSGRMRPGEKIRAAAVRKRFNTASSPVREALNRLLAEGFVALEEQKGFRVAPVSAEELKELVKTRCWIDGLAIRESIEQFDLAWEEISYWHSTICREHIVESRARVKTPSGKAGTRTSILLSSRGAAADG